MRGVAIDRLAVHEGIVRSGGYRIHVAGIPVVEVPEIVDVVKIVEVVEARVIHVHMIPVTRTAAIPRTERLAPTEREPAVTSAPTESEADSNAESAAEESDECGAIIGRRINRA